MTSNMLQHHSKIVYDHEYGSEQTSITWKEIFGLANLYTS